MRVGEGVEGEGERLCTECRAQLGAGCQDPEIMTWVPTKSWFLNGLHHPGTPPSFFVVNCVTSRKLLNPNVLSILICNIGVVVGLLWLLCKIIHTQNLESTCHIAPVKRQLLPLLLEPRVMKRKEESRARAKREMTQEYTWWDKVCFPKIHWREVVLKSQGGRRNPCCSTTYTLCSENDLLSPWTQRKLRFSVLCCRLDSQEADP